MSFALAVDVSKGIDVGGILRKTLAIHEAKHAAVWTDCEIDPAQFSRALIGLAPLDLWKLRQLEPHLLVDFLRSFATAVVHEWFTTIHLPLQMARAALPEAKRKESA